MRLAPWVKVTEAITAKAPWKTIETPTPLSRESRPPLTPGDGVGVPFLGPAESACGAWGTVEVPSTMIIPGITQDAAGRIYRIHTTKRHLVALSDVPRLLGA